MTNADSIYTQDNRYGYRYNINHPTIRELYERYVNWKGLSNAYPLSDGERKEFEGYLDKYFGDQIKKVLDCIGA